MNRQVCSFVGLYGFDIFLYLSNGHLIIDSWFGSYQCIWYLFKVFFLGNGIFLKLSMIN